MHDGAQVLIPGKHKGVPCLAGNASEGLASAVSANLTFAHIGLFLLASSLAMRIRKEWQQRKDANSSS